MHLRNVSTFFQEETFWATLNTPHLPHSYLLLSCSPWSLSGDFCLASFVFGSVSSYLNETKPLTQSSDGEVETQKVWKGGVFNSDKYRHSFFESRLTDQAVLWNAQTRFSPSCSQINGYILSLEFIKTSAAPPLVQISTATCVFCSNWNAKNRRNWKSVKFLLLYVALHANSRQSGANPSWRDQM